MGADHAFPSWVSFLICNMGSGSLSGIKDESPSGLAREGLHTRFFFLLMNVAMVAEQKPSYELVI